jgi:hypothetical protein
MIRYANNCSTGEAETLHEALNDPLWKIAMNEEYSALMCNQTWHPLPTAQAKNFIDCKWVYKVKRMADGPIERYKTQLILSLVVSHGWCLR